MTSVAILGFGRVGKEIFRSCLDAGISVVAVFESDGSASVGKDAGILAGVQETGVKVAGAGSLRDVLSSVKPDVAIDFTSPESTVSNAKIVSSLGIDLIIGTTGLSDAQLSELKDDVKKNGVGAVISPNMSVGVNVFWKLVEKAAASLPGYDVEIIEKHHRFKKDSPSGTALKTAEVVAKALDRNSDSFVYGRRGLKERGIDEIGIHAVRAGDIVGEHTVVFGTLGESVEILHRAHSRTAFSSGVVIAVPFIVGKKGVYGMDEVLGLN